MKRVVAVSRFFMILSLAGLAGRGEAQIWKKILPDKKDEKQQVQDDNAQAVIQQLRADIGYLASDQLEGRRTGTKGEALAGMYIEKRMGQIGLMPYGQNYRRPFKFEWGKELTPELRFSISNKYISVPEDAFPAPFSAAAKDENYVLPESMESNSPWLVPLYESETDADNPHFDWEKQAFDRARKAAERGATSVLFYDKYGSKYFPAFSKRTDYEGLDIPVMVLSKKIYDLYVKDMKVMQPVMMNITFRKEFRTGTNIVGYINNNAAQTVVIGAHYDHLGYGEDGSSRATDGVKAIHNGADDNASGVGAMLAVAAKIRQSGAKKYNYLFVAFSAEELGLLGSKAFVKDKDFNPRKVAYMINMDMVGRLSPDRKLTIGGLGTSPVWPSAIAGINSNFKIVKDSSGIGPSDHTSFYNDSIPVLFFFTGTHADYHKPSDDATKINYVGTKDVVNYVFGVTAAMEKQPAPLYTATRNTTMTRTSFKVTLGIMPDYSYQEGGVRIDGVIDGKAAAKAKLQQGDIILQLGAVKINGMQSYMEALGSFNPGDKTTVKVKRGPTVQEFPLAF
ncbi:M20/M25/M40 family metallo-hydrolase [Taibaiella koreensis]|uniref:M20/M25/M40 family metallo-hydrolase n=1 Tax=Taibaiella koreensis TaxID=1268548 RepID=UPI000E59AC1C|nr:M20/M25/M40 family metallo-hydrolase [Taibaiella koreensis]